MFAPIVATTVYVPLELSERSILNPVSLFELSFHDNVICDEDFAVAVSADGATDVADQAICAKQLKTVIVMKNITTNLNIRLKVNLMGLLLWAVFIVR